MRWTEGGNEDTNPDRKQRICRWQFQLGAFCASRTTPNTATTTKAQECADTADWLQARLDKVLADHIDTGER